MTITNPDFLHNMYVAGSVIGGITGGLAGIMEGREDRKKAENSTLESLTNQVAIGAIGAVIGSTVGGFTYTLAVLAVQDGLKTAANATLTMGYVTLLIGLPILAVKANLSSES